MSREKEEGQFNSEVEGVVELNENEDLDIEIEEENLNLLEFSTYSGANPIIAKDVVSDKGWVRITPDTNKKIAALCSYGFASCLAIIVKSGDNKYISLRHSTSLDERNSIIKEEMDYLSGLGAEGLEVVVGFSLKGYEQQFKDDLEYLSKKGDSKEIKKAEIDHENFFKDLAQEKEFLSKECQAVWLDMKEPSIIIDRSGAIIDVVDEKIIHKGKKLDIKNYPDLENNLEAEPSFNAYNAYSSQLLSQYHRAEKTS